MTWLLSWGKNSHHTTKTFGILLFCVYRMIKTEVQHEPDAEGLKIAKEEPGILQHEPVRLIKPKKEPGVLQPEPETEIWIKLKEESGVLQHEPEPEGLIKPKEEPGVLQVLERLEDASETMLSR